MPKPTVLKVVKQSKTINKYLRINTNPPPPSFIGLNVVIFLMYIFSKKSYADING